MDFVLQNSRFMQDNRVCFARMQDKGFCFAKFAFYARQSCLFCTDARQRVLFCKICILCKTRGAKMLFCARQERYIPSVCGRGSVIDGDFLSAEQEPEEAQHDQEKDEVQQLVEPVAPPRPGRVVPCTRRGLSSRRI